MFTVWRYHSKHTLAPYGLTITSGPLRNWPLRLVRPTQKLLITRRMFGYTFSSDESLPCWGLYSIPQTSRLMESKFQWLLIQVAQTSGKFLVYVYPYAFWRFWLRVNPPGGIGRFNDTAIPLQLRYGDGSYGVSGTIALLFTGRFPRCLNDLYMERMLQLCVVLFVVFFPSYHEQIR